MYGAKHMAESRLESGELPLFVSLLERTDVFVDVGANCGLFTLMALKAGIKTVSIEPNLENIEILLFNLRDYKFTDVEVFPVAVSCQPEILPLFGGGEGASLLKNWGGMTNTYSRLVPVNSLDNLLAGRFSRERLLIKLDVEGQEFHVLQGAVKLMERNSDSMWIIEHGLTENFAGKSNPHFIELFEMFWNRGYSCFTADDQKRPIHSDDVVRWMDSGKRDFGYLNYLFCKQHDHA